MFNFFSKILGYIKNLFSFTTVTPTYEPTTIEDTRSELATMQNNLAARARTATSLNNNTTTEDHIQRREQIEGMIKELGMIKGLDNISAIPVGNTVTTTITSELADFHGTSTVTMPPLTIVENNPLKAHCEKKGYNYQLIEAIMTVESNGDGFANYPGLGNYPKLRFEPHWFNKYETKQPMPFTNNGKGYSSKASETNYVAFKKAMAINKNAAIKATSFGKYQIMGFHYKKLGYTKPEDFLNAMHIPLEQDLNFIKFLEKNKILLQIISMKPEDITLDVLKKFAKSYNGSGNVETYAKKLQKAYKG